ncbi:GNAT family N-acetyltransferase [Tistrella bauzanensis]
MRPPLRRWSRTRRWPCPPPPSPSLSAGRCCRPSGRPRPAAGREHAFAIIDGIAPETGPGTGPLIGMMTLRPDIDDGDGRTADLGYVLGRDWWGRGIATAAGRKVLVVARDQLALARIAADVKHDNHRSAAVLRRLGFTETGRRMKYWPARGGMVLVRRFVLVLRAPRPAP